ncbi:hypothetical protein ACHAXA_002181 [Cyclostephanos tholiformis]|uniref:Sulfotransferase domain-containing protein n=1 Tax=Cyclostephanos tholiformis TaxID=382380 RepID=A0ABD3RVJ8_9STRA
MTNVAKLRRSLLLCLTLSVLSHLVWSNHESFLPRPNIPASPSPPSQRHGEASWERATKDGVDEEKVEEEEEEEDCFRARGDSARRWRRMHVHDEDDPAAAIASDHLPVINLGMPKIGSTSLWKFMACAGLRASHWKCGDGSYYCADCIRDSVSAGLLPLDKCGNYDAYAQIDGPLSSHDRASKKLIYFPQIEMLDGIFNAYPNATYVLTFRSMDGWHRSLSNWFSSLSSLSMKERMERSNVTGLYVDANDTIATKRRVFDDFFCDHVKRVRRVVPRERLVEIDIEDENAGVTLAETFDADASCWVHANANRRFEGASGVERNRTVRGSGRDYASSSIRGKKGGRNATRQTNEDESKTTQKKNESSLKGGGKD